VRLANGESISSTPNHPFYVDGKGFVPAGRLAIGNAIVTRAGPPARVASVHLTGRQETVYNLEVADFHTYFVCSTSGGFWVHNVGCDNSGNGGPFYRGSAPGEEPNLTARSGTDVKPVGGIVSVKGGVSVVNDPNKLHPNYPIANPVSPDLPPGLQIVQRGKPNHFKIEPTEPMPFENYKKLLDELAGRSGFK